MRIVTALAFTLLAGAAVGEPLVIKDAERFPAHGRQRGWAAVKAPAPMALPRPCCTGYVGSVYGLGKPNVTGVSPRPLDGWPPPGQP